MGLDRLVCTLYVLVFRVREFGAEPILTLVKTVCRDASSDPTLDELGLREDP